MASINPSSSFTIEDERIDFYDENWHIKKHHIIPVDPELSSGNYSDFNLLVI